MTSSEQRITGEIYKADNGNIYMWGVDDSSYYFGGKCNTWSIGNGSFAKSTPYPVTPFEKAWFLYCREKNQFISKEDFHIIYSPNPEDYEIF